MIPRTFPSSRASNGATQMIVYFLPSVAGLTRWVDYIPVKFTTVATPTTENTYNQNGYIPVVSLSSIAGATPFKEYVPVFLDSNAADADVWDVTITGFIPVGTAGIGGAALYMDFAATTTLDPRITFGRTTNATVTGPDGTLQWAPHNLLTFSEQFDNAAWTKTSSVIAANSSIAPNSTTTADTLSDNTSLTNHNVLQAVNWNLGVHTFSVYVKYVDHRWLSVRIGVSGNQFFGSWDLLNGVVGSVTAGATHAITPVGDGWFRVTLTANLTTAGTANLIVGLNNTDSLSLTSYAGTGTSIQLWGAQLNVGALQPYNPTTVKNLLGFTQEFDNAAWTKSNSTVTANAATAPDGSLTADLVNDSLDASATAHAVVSANNSFVSGTTYTVSLYAKQGTLPGVALLFPAAAFTSALNARFNLATGTITIFDAGLTGSITAVGDGWYRCSATATATATASGQLQIRTATSTTSFYQGAGTGTVLIWGAQLSDSASLDPYVYQPVAAPASTAYYGPRFDYDPVTLAPRGLLIEEQRTNLLVQSEALDNASWVKTAATINQNSLISPDGTQDADKLVEDATNAGHFVGQSVSATSGVTYTSSIYAKAGERSVLQSSPSASYLSAGFANFDLVSGTVTAFSANVTASMQNVGNGWYRCVTTFTATATATGNFAYFIQTSTTALRGAAYQGDGTSGLFFYGAQLEVGAFATSYIPTTTAAATRAADVATMIGANFSNWYRQDEGTIYSECVFSAANQSAYSISDGTSNNRMFAWVNTTTTNNFRVITGSSIQADLSSTASLNTLNKQAAAFANNNFASTLNGGTVLTDTVGTVPVVNRLQLGDNPSGSSAPLNGYIRRITYYPRRLSNTELQTITS